jgi:hypothetical protein
MRRLGFVLAIGCLLASAVPAFAFGRPIERFHDHSTATFPDDPTTTFDDLCGIPVTTHVVARENGIVRLDRRGDPVFKLSGRARITWVNPATGLWVTNFIAGQFREIRIVENPDGTTTIFSTNTGIPELLRSSDGTVLVKDVGRIVFASTFDFGDPGDFEDDVFLGFEIVSVSGPHPEAESDFALFCQVIVPALT